MDYCDRMQDGQTEKTQSCRDLHHDKSRTKDFVGLHRERSQAFEHPHLYHQLSLGDRSRQRSWRVVEQRIVQRRYVIHGPTGVEAVVAQSRLADVLRGDVPEVVR
jgi:hypothetical protein